MTEARALAAQERELLLQRAQRFGRGLVIVMATTMTFAALLVVAADQLFRPASFNIEQLKISGKFRHTTPEAIEAFVRQQTLGNFFSLDLAQLQNGLEELAWVQLAQVRRVWPDTLSIRIVEHRPVMRWQDIDNTENTHALNTAGDQLWLSASGEVISVPAFNSGNAVITLRGTRSHSQQMLQTALRWKRQFASFGLEPLTISQGESQAWRIQLASNHQSQAFELLLGSANVEQRLQRFKYLYDTEFRFAKQELSRVDARYPNGLAVEHSAVVRSTEPSTSGQTIGSTTENAQG